MRFVSAMASAVPRRFAPLQGAANEAGIPRLQGVVFDMDGTLCEPQTYMFGEMRAALGIPSSIDILQHIESLPPSQQPAAVESIRAIERRVMESQVPQPGLTSLMAFLDARRVRKAICTRNFDVPVQNLLTKFLAGSVFDPVVTRDFRPPKPDPAGILHIAANWGLRGDNGVPDASGLIMVGDSLDDMTAGRKAGAATVLLVNDVNRHLEHHEHTDLVINRLDDLVAILEHGFEGRDVGAS
ncbi:putative hydrolase [Tolypocladium capitatum]|uniref:Putative hydrolase n=1 Tax=Tolypocladium capitatum TaxID=45235 RepID=A0A2K3QC54_9HYPO|nr:putative hydrolase [Tolypocladium capitatum]